MQEKSFQKFETQKYKNEIEVIFGQSEDFDFLKSKLRDARNNGVVIYRVRACVRRDPFLYIINVRVRGRVLGPLKKFIKKSSISC